MEQSEHINQSQEESSKEQISYQDNSNVYKDNKEINSNNNSSDSEIIKLKEEIQNLKNMHKKDELQIKEIKTIFQKEIDSLKKQIKDMSDQLNEINHNKNKKKNSSNDCIINDNSDVSMEESQTYSVECLSKRVNIEILQGTEKANIDIVIRNNSNEKYPSNSYLICDNKNSLLLCEKVKLNELEPNQQQNVSFLFKNLKFISKGTYRSIIKLQINNKTYNSFFELNVIVLENPIKKNQNLGNNNDNLSDFSIPQKPNDNSGNYNMDIENIEQMIISFKDTFDFYNERITDIEIEQALRKYNFDFQKTFESFFD